MAAPVNKTKMVAYKPVIGSKMASRNVEVRAVGAWVQPAPKNQMHQEDAVESARIEEDKVSRQQQEKAARLQQFQQDVKRRVQMLEQTRRHQQLQSSYKAVEMERNMVGQTSSASERAIPRKNRCTLRHEEHLAISHRASSGDQSETSSNSEQEQALHDQTNKVHQCVSHAKRKLISRQVINERNDNAILWRKESGSDAAMALKESQNVALDVDEADTLQTTASSTHDPDLSEPLSHDLQIVPSEGGEEVTEIQEVVAIDLVTQNDKKSVSSGSDRAVPNIYPGVSCQEEKRREQSQRAMYRRLFMDIEREQVKENMRQKQHKVKINQLKKEAEAERRRVESLAQQIIEPRDPLTGETTTESFNRKQQEEAELQRSLTEQQQRRQRHREATRFLEALKQSLREKIAKQNIELPPMCCCGETVWDTNPDTCANNCVFYRNPKAYARALQSLLASCDVA